MRARSKLTAAENLPRPRLSPDGSTVTIHVPVTFRKFGGRKQVYTPAGMTPWVPESARINTTLVKAVVRAHRWRDLLESRQYPTIRELAKAEKINESYLCRMLRLTLLSPRLIEEILQGRQPPNVELATFLSRLPSEWKQQEAVGAAGDRV